MILVGNFFKRLIYVYEFPDNVCYVGLTCNIEKRKNEHSNNNKSSVFKYIEKVGHNYKLIIKSDYIDVYEAIILEESVLNEYKINGWKILNRIKTGGVGNSIIKWDYKSCEAEALKYNKMGDFIKMSIGAYTAAIKNNWIDDITLHFDKTSSKFYWNNKNRCEIESKKYKGIYEFKNKNWTAYNYSKLNNWLSEFYPKRVTTAKNVYQYNMENEFIKIFMSLREASKELKLNANMISNVCLGKKTSYKGYIFKYN
jgi:predicted GIY-YIG superfamily endonuclease